MAPFGWIDSLCLFMSKAEMKGRDREGSGDHALYIEDDLIF
jgi:hypothetical protein